MTKETPEERKNRFQAMSSSERISLIKEKMKAEGLEEGSGVKGIIYDNEEVLDLIRITSCFPDMQVNKFRKN
tara:strand:- start:141 stop:356 length:216 start_codon:yes stop_codon:yes gene_type:complete